MNTVSSHELISLWVNPLWYFLCSTLLFFCVSTFLTFRQLARAEGALALHEDFGCLPFHTILAPLSTCISVSRAGSVSVVRWLCSIKKSCKQNTLSHNIHYCCCMKYCIENMQQHSYSSYFSSLSSASVLSPSEWYRSSWVLDVCGNISSCIIPRV